MKIKGTYKSNTSGKKYGDPIEFSPKEKIPLAVEDALKVQSPKGEMYLVERVESEGEPYVLPRGTPNEKSFANNAYQAEGIVRYKRFVTETDELFPAVEKRFSITFEDSIDEWGQPDITVTNFSLT